MGTARVELELTNAAGDDLNDFVRIELFSASTSDHYQNNVQVQRKVAVGGIEVDPTSVYRVVLTPSNYRLVQFFVMLTDGQTLAQTVPFPVDPARVTGIQAPAFGGLPAGVKSVLKQSRDPALRESRRQLSTGERSLWRSRPGAQAQGLSAEYHGQIGGHAAARRHHLSRPL